MKTLKLPTIFTVLFSFSFYVNAAPKSNSPEWCEVQWRAESSSLDIDSAQSSNIVERWEMHRKNCESTTVFESRLAMAYALSGQFEKARKVVQSIDAHQTKYQYLAAFSGVVVDYLSTYSQKTIHEADVLKIKEKLLAYVSKYPDFPDAQGLLGGIQSFLGDHKAAIGSLERAKNTTMDASGVYRNLAISYAEVGRYQEAIGAADTAYGMKKTLTSDQYFMYALAKANAGEGDFKAAENALRVIAAKKPEVRRDPNFKEAVDFVIAKSNASQ